MNYEKTPSTSTPSTPMKAIRKKCLDCSGESSNEVKECVIPECPLFPFRLGKNPFRKPQSEAQREAARQRMIQLQERRNLPISPVSLTEENEEQGKDDH